MRACIQTCIPITSQGPGLHRCTLPFLMGSSHESGHRLCAPACAMASGADHSTRWPTADLDQCISKVGYSNGLKGRLHD